VTGHTVVEESTITVVITSDGAGEEVVATPAGELVLTALLTPSVPEEAPVDEGEVAAPEDEDAGEELPGVDEAAGLDEPAGADEAAALDDPAGVDDTPAAEDVEVAAPEV
jgi:hypothetical protein